MERSLKDSAGSCHATASSLKPQIGHRQKKEAAWATDEVDGMAKQDHCVAWRRWCGGKLW